MRFKNWVSQSRNQPSTRNDVALIVRETRGFVGFDKLDYGDHGLDAVLHAVRSAIAANKRIALYADYDVDGTMSCVAWIWFLEAIGYKNYIHYIPCRFAEGYGVNLSAVQHLVNDQSAEIIITMDTGITANAEAEWCRDHGVVFICTDHHKIQLDRMPDCLILNPKTHPDAAYQDLCGCGITFVLLRKLAPFFPVLQSNPTIWTDILALTGMATICDVVPLNGVNHKLAKLGVDALLKSKRPVLAKLRAAASVVEADEKDVGFKLGPRINAVGRLEHASLVIRAFIENEPGPLIAVMNSANERRRHIQADIVKEARSQCANLADSSIVFIGGDWHPGVVGIAASKICEERWRPTWLFQRKDGICKGSARSIRGFDVTDAMSTCTELFVKFGGHAAAGGFVFKQEHEAEIRRRLNHYAEQRRTENPNLWESVIAYDCELPPELLTFDILETLDDLKPFGHAFEEPKFKLTLPVKSVTYYNDKLTGQPKHTCVVAEINDAKHKILFFNDVLSEITPKETHDFIVSLSKNTFHGQTSLSLMGHDWMRHRP